MAETTPKFVYNAVTVELDYPLALNDPYQINARRKDLISVSGKKQSIFDYNEEVKQIDIQFASSATKDALVTMFDSWASEGKSLDFHPDKDSATKDTVTIVENSFKIERQATGTNVFKVKFKIRKDV